MSRIELRLEGATIATSAEYEKHPTRPMIKFRELYLHYITGAALTFGASPQGLLANAEIWELDVEGELLDAPPSWLGQLESVGWVGSNLIYKNGTPSLEEVVVSVSNGSFADVSHQEMIDFAQKE